VIEQKQTRSLDERLADLERRLNRIADALGPPNQPKSAPQPHLRLVEGGQKDAA
jgi:hypothetical protein